MYLQYGTYKHVFQSRSIIFIVSRARARLPRQRTTESELQISVKSVATVVSVNAQSKAGDIFPSILFYEVAAVETR